MKRNFLLIFVVIYISVKFTESTIPAKEILNRDSSLWHDILFNSSANGVVVRDMMIERILVQLLNETIIPKIRARTPPYNMADPLWLMPVEVEVKKKRLKAKVEACDLYLHNLKQLQLLHLDVQRSANLDFYAFHMIIHIPIIWISGFYKLIGVKVLSFIPAKGEGDFNVDIKNVDVAIISTFSMNSNNTVDLDKFEVGISWDKLVFKFDNLGGGTMTDWILNQFGIGNLIVNKQRETITEELEAVFRALNNCILTHSARGIEPCMDLFWISRGWELPFVFPTC